MSLKEVRISNMKLIDVPARASKGTYEISKYSEKHAVSSDSERLCFQFGN
jgi:hypothetical protein